MTNEKAPERVWINSLPESGRVTAYVSPIREAGSGRVLSLAEYVRADIATPASTAPVVESPILAFQTWLERWVVDNGRKLTQDEYGIAYAAFIAAHPGEGPKAQVMAAPVVDEHSAAFTAYNKAIEDVMAAIRAESQGGGYWAATFINAIARKCSPHVYVASLPMKPRTHEAPDPYRPVCKHCGLADIAGDWNKYPCNDEWRKDIATNY